MKRIAVIGAGTHSALHHGHALRSYAATHPGEIELVAVCDLDESLAKRYAATFGFPRTYIDYRLMMERERPDGLVAITPLSRTAAIAGELLGFGIPMVIEKPPGESSAETRLLLEAAAKRGTPHMVSFNRRFIPAVVRAREWISAGGAGRAPKLMVARMLRHARREKGFPVGTGIHLIDTVLSIMGPPRRIRTVQAPTDFEGRFLYSVSIDFGAGRSAAVVISPDVGTEEESFEIHGQDYTIHVDSIRCTLRVVEGRKEVLAWQPAPDAAYELVCGALGETGAFIAALQSGRGFAPELQEALVSMLASEAVEAGGDVALKP